MKFQQLPIVEGGKVEISCHVQNRIWSHDGSPERLNLTDFEFQHLPGTEN